VWLWRWRRNPLRRRSDRLEAWLLLATWVIATAGSLLAGVTVSGGVEQSLDQQQLERHAVTAVLAEDSAGKASAKAIDDDHVWATVRWRAIDGSARTGQTKVSPSTPKGTPVTVWTDGQGRLTSKPLSHAEARLQGIWAGTLAATGAGAAVVGGAQVLRGRLDRRRMQEWADEWQRVDAGWGRTTG
jgi:hypothetical protein